MDQMNDNDSDRDPPDIDSPGGYSGGLSLWSLSNSNCTYISTDEDNTSSLTTNSFIEEDLQDLSYIPSIRSSSTFSDFESSINNELFENENNEHLDSNSIAVKGQEIDKKSQSQSMDFIDSNKLAEDAMQIPHDLKFNVIIPPVFDTHSGDSEKCDIAALDSTSLLSEKMAEIMSAISTLKQKLTELKDTNEILDETQFKSYDDTVQYKKIKLKTLLPKKCAENLDNFCLAKSTVKTILNLKFFKGKYDGNLIKTVSEIIGPLGNCVDPSLRNSVVANLIHVKFTMGDGDSDNENSDEDINQNTNASNSAASEVQQSGPINDGQSAQIHHRDPYQSLVDEHSRPNVVECYEAVDTSSSSELVGLQSTTSPQLHNEWIANNIKSLMSFLFSSGGQITSLLPTRVIIDMNGQKIVLTSDPAFYQMCLHNSKSVGPPDCVAKLYRDYLTAPGVHSTTMMIDNAPTVIGLLLLSGDTVADLVRRHQKDALISKIQRRSNNDSDSEDVMMVANRDPESNHSMKEDIVVLPANSNLEVNCAGRQVSSASVTNLMPSFHSGPASANENQEKFIIENLMPLFHSGSASANENQERLITVTHQSLHMELCDQIERLVPPQFQELRFLMYRLSQEDPELYNTFVQTLRRQMCVQLVEPHTAEALPTTYIQGVSILYDGSDPDHERFLKTYNMPYYFSPPPCGEPCSVPSLSVDVANSPYPVNCIAVSAPDDPSDPPNSGDGQENAILLCSESGRGSIVYQPPNSIQQLISRCHGLGNVIEELLERDPEFHDHFTHMMSQQYQPCEVHILPVINMGAVGGMPFLCDGSDSDPEQWSKAYKKPGNFPSSPCGEPSLLEPSLDEKDDYPYNINCEPHPCSDAIGEVLSSCGSELESKDCDKTSSSDSDSGVSETFIMS